MAESIDQNTLSSLLQQLLVNQQASSTATTTVSTVSIKLPEFWIKSPEVWFARVEAQFNTRNVSTDQTKYDYVVSTLDINTAKEMQAGVRPSTLEKLDPYDQPLDAPLNPSDQSLDATDDALDDAPEYQHLPASRSWDSNEIDALRLDWSRPPRCNLVCMHHFCPTWLERTSRTRWRRSGSRGRAPTRRRL